MAAPSGDRVAMLSRNADALGELQPGLATGLREIPSEFLTQMEALHVPNVDRERLEVFAQAAAGQATGDVLVVLGLGSPEMAKILRSALPPDRGLLFIEPTLDVAVRLLSQYDFTEAVESGLCALLFAGDDHSLQNQVEQMIIQWGVTELQLITNPMRPMGDRTSHLVGELLRAALRGVEISAATSSHYGRDSLSNIAANLRAGVTGLDPTMLAGSLKGVPAFVIGAGPSLDAVQGMLPQLASHGVVIACDAALPILMANGAPPDIVVTLDVAPTKSVLFEQQYVKDALLVTLLGAHPKLVDSWIGPRIFALDEHPLAKWALPYVSPALTFGSLGNVAQLGYATARFLGCDPIVLCGVDFSIGDFGGLYARGVKHDAALHVDKLSQGHRESMLEVPSAAGGTVKTLKNMAVYAETLGRMASAGGETYTIAPKSARMASVKLASLDALLEKFGQHKISRPIVGESHTREAITLRSDALRDAIGLLETELRAYAADASEFAEATDVKGAELMDAKTEEETLVRELQPQLERFGRHTGVIDIIEPLQPAVTFEINRLLRKTRGMDDPVQRTRTRLLALGGPAANGASLAEYAADQLRAVRVRMSRPQSGRFGAV